MTCLIGIVLFIALLLTLFAADPSSPTESTSSGKVASPEQKKTLSTLIADIVHMSNDVKASMISSFSSEEIAQKSAAARSELDDLKNQLSRYSGSQAPAGGNSEVQKSIDQIKQRSASRQGEVDGLAREEAEKQKILGELNAKALDLQEKALQEAKDTDHVWLDPTVSNTSKKPLLIQVNREGYELKELSKSASETKNGSDIELLLRDYPKSDYYAVIYFRPSTWNKYKTVAKQIKAMGFEIGTDALTESQKLDFLMPES